MTAFHRMRVEKWKADRAGGQAKTADRPSIAGSRAAFLKAWKREWQAAGLPAHLLSLKRPLSPQDLEQSAGDIHWKAQWAQKMNEIRERGGDRQLLDEIRVIRTKAVFGHERADRARWAEAYTSDLLEGPVHPVGSSLVQGEATGREARHELVQTMQLAWKNTAGLDTPVPGIPEGFLPQDPLTLAQGFTLSLIAMDAAGQLGLSPAQFHRRAQLRAGKDLARIGVKVQKYADLLERIEQGEQHEGSRRLMGKKHDEYQARYQTLLEDYQAMGVTPMVEDHTGSGQPELRTEGVASALKAALAPVTDTLGSWLKPSAASTETDPAAIRAYEDRMRELEQAIEDRIGRITGLLPTAENPQPAHTAPADTQEPTTSAATRPQAISDTIYRWIASLNGLYHPTENKPNTTEIENQVEEELFADPKTHAAHERERRAINLEFGNEATAEQQTNDENVGRQRRHHTAFTPIPGSALETALADPDFRAAIGPEQAASLGFRNETIPERDLSTGREEAAHSAWEEFCNTEEAQNTAANAILNSVQDPQIQTMLHRVARQLLRNLTGSDAADSISLRTPLLRHTYLGPVKGNHFFAQPKKQKDFSLFQVLSGEPQRSAMRLDTDWVHSRKSDIVFKTVPKEIADAAMSEQARQEFGSRIGAEALKIVNTPANQNLYQKHAAAIVRTAASLEFLEAEKTGPYTDAVQHVKRFLLNEDNPDLVRFRKVGWVPNVVAFGNESHRLLISAATGKTLRWSMTDNGPEQAKRLENFIRMHLSNYDSSQARTEHFKPLRQIEMEVSGPKMKLRSALTFGKSENVYTDLWQAGLNRITKDADRLAYTPSEEAREQELVDNREFWGWVQKLASIAGLYVGGVPGLGLGLLSGGSGITSGSYEMQRAREMDEGDLADEVMRLAKVGMALDAAGIGLDLYGAASLFRSGIKMPTAASLKSTIRSVLSSVTRLRLSAKIPYMYQRTPAQATALYARALSENPALARQVLEGGSSMDVVLRLERLTKRLTDDEAAELSGATLSKFLGGKEMKGIPDPDSFARLGEGERLAIVRADDHTIIQTMTSTGRGRAAGVNNDSLNPALGKTYQEIDVLRDAGVKYQNGKWMLHDGTDVKFYTHAKSYEFRVSPVRGEVRQVELTPDQAAARQQWQDEIMHRTTSSRSRSGETLRLADLAANPSENCEAALDSVVRYMRDKGFTDIEIRGVGMWSRNGVYGNHFLAIGTHSSDRWAFDITAGQFSDRGMPRITGAIIDLEQNWAHLFQGGRLVKYADFSNKYKAMRAFPVWPESPLKYTPDAHVLHATDRYRKALEMPLQDRTLHLRFPGKDPTSYAITDPLGAPPVRQNGDGVDIELFYPSDAVSFAIGAQMMLGIEAVGRIVKAVFSLDANTSVNVEASNCQNFTVPANTTQTIEVPAGTTLSITFTSNPRATESEPDPAGPLPIPFHVQQVIDLSQEKHWSSLNLMLAGLQAGFEVTDWVILSNSLGRTPADWPDRESLPPELWQEYSANSTGALRVFLESVNSEKETTEESKPALVNTRSTSSPTSRATLSESYAVIGRFLITSRIGHNQKVAIFDRNGECQPTNGNEFRLVGTISYYIRAGDDQVAMFRVVGDTLQVKVLSKGYELDVRGADLGKNVLSTQGIWDLGPFTPSDNDPLRIITTRK